MHFLVIIITAYTEPIQKNIFIYIRGSITMKNSAILVGIFDLRKYRHDNLAHCEKVLRSARSSQL